MEYRLAHDLNGRGIAAWRAFPGIFSGAFWVSLALARRLPES